MKVSLIIASGTLALTGIPIVKAMSAQAPSSQSALSFTGSEVVGDNVGSNNPTNRTNTQAQKASASKIIAPLKTGSIGCVTTSKPVRQGMAQSPLGQLQKLSQYEQACNSAIFDRASFFTILPTSIKEAEASAEDVARILKEYARFNISPVVFLEPTNNSGLVSLAELRRGAYDSVLRVYFAQLQSNGITDTMMGTWVPIPEGNLPIWSSVDPNDYSESVTKIATIQKRTFPGSKTSILLDTRTYPRAGDWSGGQALSFRPYIQNIPKGLIDSIGLQGFPWEPASNLGQANNGAPKDYLRVDLLIEAIQIAGLNDAWINSGTFSSAYTGQVSKQVTITPTQRRALLESLIVQLRTIQSAGISVSMHLFAQDKSRVSEGTNWSYWNDGQYTTSESTVVFKNFSHDLQAMHIPLWIFDTKTN